MKKTLNSFISLISFALVFILQFIPVISVNSKGYSLFGFILGFPLRDPAGEMGVMIEHINVLSIQAIALFSFVILIALAVMYIFFSEQKNFDLLIKIVAFTGLFFYSGWLGIVKFSVTGCAFTFTAILSILLYIAACLSIVFETK